MVYMASLLSAFPEVGRVLEGGRWAGIVLEGGRWAGIKWKQLGGKLTRMYPLANLMHMASLFEQNESTQIQLEY